MRARAFYVAAVLLAIAVPAAAQLPDRRGVLEEERARYGATLTQAQAGELLNRVALRLKAEGFGLLRKDGGNSCPQPTTGIAVSCDWLVHRPSGTGCDVLGAGPGPEGPGPSRPQWCGGDPFDVSRFVAPADSGTPPPPPPPPDDLAAAVAALDARVADLERRIRILETAPTTPPTTTPQLEVDVHRIRELLEAVAKRFGVE